MLSPDWIFCYSNTVGEYIFIKTLLFKVYTPSNVLHGPIYSALIYISRLIFWQLLNCILSFTYFIFLKEQFRIFSYCLLSFVLSFFLLPLILRFQYSLTFFSSRLGSHCNSFKNSFKCLNSNWLFLVLVSYYLLTLLYVYIQRDILMSWWRKTSFLNILLKPMCSTIFWNIIVLIIMHLILCRNFLPGEVGILLEIGNTKLNNINSSWAFSPMTRLWGIKN